jgi:hypothetical protein
MVITCVFTTAGGRVDHHVCDARKHHLRQQRREIYANGVDDHAGCAPAHITTAGGVGGHQAIDARSDAGGVGGHHVLDACASKVPATARRPTLELRRQLQPWSHGGIAIAFVIVIGALTD